MGELELTWVVAFFGIAITLLGILGLIRPGNLIRLVQRTWPSPQNQEEERVKV